MSEHIRLVGLHATDSTVSSASHSALSFLDGHDSPQASSSSRPATNDRGVRWASSTPPPSSAPRARGQSASPRSSPHSTLRPVKVYDASETELDPEEGLIAAEATSPAIRGYRRSPPARSLGSRIFTGLAWTVCGPFWFLGFLARVAITPFRAAVPSGPRSICSPVAMHDRKHRFKEFPPNAVKNQKYTLVSFVPVVLYEQFKYFFNLYFLLVACSQFIPSLQIGYLVTYFGPLVFVLMVTMAKEAADDIKRARRDAAANAQPVQVLDPELGTFIAVPSSELVVGDLVQVTKNQRIPADLVLLRTHDKAGSCFIRTDQLDGETDWKLKLALHGTQTASADCALAGVEMMVDAEPPSKDIHAFTGNLTIHSAMPQPLPSRHSPSTRTGSATNSSPSGSAAGRSPVEPISADNMLWMNTVLASPDPILGCVVYTGRDTRAVMNTNLPAVKVGKLDMEVNRLSKILFAVTAVLSFVMIYFSGFHGAWGVYLVRFMILFSSIIPISLRVNLDMGKLFHAQQIMWDTDIPDTIARTSTIPEELGRIEYLLSDKTGTLTRNEMDMKKVHVGTIAFGLDSFEEMRQLVETGLAAPLTATVPTGNLLDTAGVLSPQSPQLLPVSPALVQLPSLWGTLQPSPSAAAAFGAGSSLGPATNKRGHVKSRDMASRASDLVLALALCHNVNLIVSESDGSLSLQAASPDEIALVRWAQHMGVSLMHRDVHSIRVMLPNGRESTFDILHVFPFTSESKRMGIVLRNVDSQEIMFLQKGADAVMTRLVQYNDWLDEECDTMSREGLRTLVVARKRLSPDLLARFNECMHTARTALVGRAEAVQAVVTQFLEHDLEILGLTGVEDKLQEDVRPTLESLRNAGIKVWMLTGDKVETATCIALSSKLVSRQHSIYTIAKVKTPHEAEEELSRLVHATDACLIIDGESLAVCLEHCLSQFLTIATRLPAVVCCRCSPTQKSQVTEAIKAHTGRRVCCIGDGGNDVSMINSAHVGVGIVGKEGMQASLAADFSITQFSHLTRLILWHGRNSYQRSAKLAHFVIHRGLIISIMQAVFSAIFYFAPIALYQGMLLVGYTTVYTMWPLFSLVLDFDVPADLALLFPELYKDLLKGRQLSFKTFFIWLLVSVYQGGAIMMLALLLFDNDFVHVVSISFTALIFNELLMVALEIVNWHRYMLWAQVASVVIYLVSMAILPEFDLTFILTLSFAWKSLAITALSSVPLFLIKRIRFHFAPPSYQKLVNNH